MMILNMLACIVLFMAFLLIMMGIIVRKLREKAIKRDKVITRTGGLAHDRIYEKKDIIVDDMEENRS